MSVDLSFHAGAALLRLDRPEVLNALSFEMLRALDAGFDEISASSSRVLVLSGAGPKAFCAGADVGELTGRDLVAEKRGAEFGQRVFAKLAALPMPSVAAIQGYAFGGGLELAMAATFRLVSRQARLGLPEIKLGLIPGYGGTQRLPRLVGEARALEIILTGRVVDAEEAVRIGLANALFDGDPVEAALSYAAGFTGYSLPVLEMARSAVTRALDLPIAEGLKVEADLSTLAFRTEDAREGMAAFLAKRRPEFRDA